MAMIDYGTIVIRDGILINPRQMFMSKTDLGHDIPYGVYRFDNKNIQYDIKDEYFAYVGDPDFMVCFYKSHCIVIINNFAKGFIYFGEASSNYIQKEDIGYVYCTKPPFEKFLNIFDSGVDITVEALNHDFQYFEWDIRHSYPFYLNRYHVSFDYKEKHYDIYTGYGIDNDIDVYNDIKHKYYGYTEKEIKILDAVFGINGDKTNKEEN